MTQAPSYHSLHRHVQSILPQSVHRDAFNIYSSNQQPPVPTILSKSRAKKSHEKSLKKGISRVSKSKTNLKEQNLNLFQKQKGTLLNFNIQDVIGKEYHISKPIDEIIQKDSKQLVIQTGRQHEKYNSNDNSFISEYRIVTYVPSGYQTGVQGSPVNMIKQTTEPKESQVREKREEQTSCISQRKEYDKQNNLNQSNLYKTIHQKQQSEQVQVVNPPSEHILELNTWRTQSNNDPYYSKNYRSDIGRTDLNFVLNYEQSQKESYGSNQNRSGLISQSQLFNRSQNKSIKIEETAEIREKIKHLEHEIVESEKEKMKLIIQNEQLKRINTKLTQQGELKTQKIQYLQDKVLSLEQQLKKLHSQVLKPKPFNQISQDLSQIQRRQTHQRQKSPSFQQNLRQQIQHLQLLNSKASKQLSEKNLTITELNRKIKTLSENLIELQREMKKDKQKIQTQEQKLYRKDEKINELSLEIDKLTLELKERASSKAESSTLLKFQSLDVDNRNDQTNDTKQRRQLEDTRDKYEKLQRDYIHLQKKSMFLQDQLDHLKYLQGNGNSSAFSHRSSVNKYSSLNEQASSVPKSITNNYQQQMIMELETRLEIKQRNLFSVQEQYSNLKQNFRALEQLYIKQQDDAYQMQQQLSKTSQQNEKLKIQLKNQQQIFKAKLLTAQRQNDSLKYLQSQQELLRLQKDHSALERKFSELNTQLNILKRQRDELSKKYIDQMQKTTQIAKKQKQQLQRYLKQIQQEEKAKTEAIVLRYQTLIEKLNEEISSKQQQITSLKQTHLTQLHNLQNQLQTKISQILSKQKRAHENLAENYQKELTLLEDELSKKNIQIDCLKQAYTDEMKKIKQQHALELNDLMASQAKQCPNCQEYEQRLKQKDKDREPLVQTSQRQNALLNSKYSNKYQTMNRSRRLYSASKMDIFVNFEVMSRKEIQAFATNLQEQFNLMEHKFKTLTIQKQRLQDGCKQNSRLLNHLQQEIMYYKEQKQNQIKQKLQLCSQLQKVNSSMIEIKKINSNFQNQRVALQNQLTEAKSKFINVIQQKDRLMKQVQKFKVCLNEKDFKIQRFEHDLRDLRILVLEEKEKNDRLIKERGAIEEERQSHRAKQEYYKMLFQKTQRQLQSQLQEKSLLLLNQSKPQPSPQKISPVEQKLPSRETQLYRLEIYRDLNKLLSLTSQSFTFEEIVQKNEQQYLRKLFNAIKEDHEKIIELKKLIVGMEESFKSQKVHIKEDYDLVYEKYLKYKAMCQSMEKDIQKFKQQLKKKDDKFANINL